MRRFFGLACVFAVLLGACAVRARDAGAKAVGSYDVIIVGGTPGGIMAGVAVGRGGRTAVILDRNEHIGGLPANGLGATDIHTRGATEGLFTEFVGRIRKFYLDKYGEESEQFKLCSDGYHFEPHVAEMVFEEMLAELKDKVTVLKRRQFDALGENVVIENNAIVRIVVANRDTGEKEVYAARVFIDATYEGDLAAAAGASYRLGRESKSEFDEPMAGRLYKQWGGPAGPGSTGLGDNAVQAYNYRLCLTMDEHERVAMPKPQRYSREEYVSLIDDIKLNRWPAGANRHEKHFHNSIGRLVNMVNLPNGKTDSNNQHAAFISTDLPEENWPWPTSGWDWRDGCARRLRDYTLGLLWFAQHDEALPESFRKNCLEWGLAKSEYADNGHFPRAVYVREGRRIEGEYLFTAHDALSKRGSREHATSITASHYSLDSHAVRKREPGRAHLDGFFSYPTKPYSVPYGVIVPKGIDGLLTPVPVSGTHIGFSTLRMEPCWMAMGQAAGVAACVSIEDKTAVRGVDILKVQRELLKQGAVLIYFKDAKPGDEHYEALQFFALRGFYEDAWEAKLKESATKEIASKWIKWAGVNKPREYKTGRTTTGELLDMLYDRVLKKSSEETHAIFRK